MSDELQGQFLGEPLESSKGKTKYRAVYYKRSVIKIGDVVELNNMGGVPHIGIIKELFSRVNERNKLITVQWFYRQADFVEQPDVANRYPPNHIFLSKHTDENYLEAVLRKCFVQTTSPPEARRGISDWPPNVSRSGELLPGVSHASSQSLADQGIFVCNMHYSTQGSRFELLSPSMWHNWTIQRQNRWTDGTLIRVSGDAPPSRSPSASSSASSASSASASASGSSGSSQARSNSKSATPSASHTPRAAAPSRAATPSPHTRGAITRGKSPSPAVSTPSDDGTPGSRRHTRNSAATDYAVADPSSFKTLMASSGKQDRELGGEANDFLFRKVPFADASSPRKRRREQEKEEEKEEEEEDNEDDSEDGRGGRRRRRHEADIPPAKLSKVEVPNPDRKRTSFVMFIECSLLCLFMLIL